MTSSLELKPCPFLYCNGQAKISYQSDDWQGEWSFDCVIWCSHDSSNDDDGVSESESHARVYATGSSSNEAFEKAAKKWNERQHSNDQ